VRIALRETRSFLARSADLDRVVMVCYGSGAYETYRKILDETSTH